MVKVFECEIPSEEGCLEAYLDSLVDSIVDLKTALTQKEKRELKKLKKLFPKIADKFPVLFEE